MAPSSNLGFLNLDPGDVWAGVVVDDVIVVVVLAVVIMGF